MASGISGLGSFSSAQFEQMFTRIDTNGDGTVSKDEFVTGAPDDLSAEKAGALYDTLDSEGTGALSQSDLATAFQQMAASMQAGMIQAQSVGGSQTANASDLFAKLDADGDGAVSQEEFVAGRPDDVSEEDASALYGKLFGEDTESVDSETFVAAMQPPAGGGGGGGGGGGESDEVYDALDTNKDGVVSREEFLAGRPEEVSEEEAVALFESLAGEDADSITSEQLAQDMQGPPPAAEETGTSLSQDEQDLVDKLIAALQSGGTGASSDGTTASAMQQLMSAIEAYSKSQQSGSALYGSGAASAVSLSA